MEGFLVSTLGQYVVTELIKNVITFIQKAVMCKRACEKLRVQLVDIQPDVTKIEKRLATVRGSNLPDAHDDVQMVNGWLTKLKEAMDSAKEDVWKCNSRTSLLLRASLHESITQSYNTIANLGGQRHTLFLQLRVLMPVQPQGALHSPLYCDENPGESMLRRMSNERNDALRREDHYRSSLHYAHGHGGGGYQSEADSSSRSGGADSSGHGLDYSGSGTDYSDYGTDHSGHGMDYSQSLHFQQVRLQSSVVFRDRHHQDQAECELTQSDSMATAYGHDPNPAHDKWKY